MSIQQQQQLSQDYYRNVHQQQAMPATRYNENFDSRTGLLIDERSLLLQNISLLSFSSKTLLK